MNQIYTFGEEWLECIEIDIEKKYKTNKPQFLIKNQKNATRNDIIEWINQKLGEEKWIKYKKLEKNIFELKAIQPDPPEDLCKHEVESFLNSFPNTIFTMQNRIYPKEKLKNELLQSVKEGYTEVSGVQHEDAPNKMEVSVSQEELYWAITRGFIVLEEK